MPTIRKVKGAISVEIAPKSGTRVSVVVRRLNTNEVLCVDDLNITSEKDRVRFASECASGEPALAQLLKEVAAELALAASEVATDTIPTTPAPLSPGISDMWSAPVDGGALLDAIYRTIRRYVAVADDVAVAMTLWVVHTYAMEAAHASPILALLSPVEAPPIS